MILANNMLDFFKINFKELFARVNLVDLIIAEGLMQNCFKCWRIF